MLPFNDPFSPDAVIQNRMSGSEPSQHSLSSQSTTSGDAFSNREAASENQYIHQKEMDMYVSLHGILGAWNRDKVACRCVVLIRLYLG